MKKTFFVILLLFLAIIVGIYMNYKELLVSQNDAQKFNSEFEFYNKEAILGTDITTLINKAVNNNEKYNISKNEKELYMPDEENSIKIFVYMEKDAEEPYPMEAFVKTGLSEFTKYFGEIEFACTNVKYHKSTGKISEMVFTAKE